MKYRRLPLEGLYNARDLGGYPVESGGVTRFRQFIRSEAPRSLTSSDIEFLKAYGVTVSIDFRGDSEVMRTPSDLENISGIKYCRCPTFDGQFAFASGQAAAVKRPEMSAFTDWGEKYVELAADRKDWIRTTLKEMAKAEGAVIFNCTTGKDRTGLISALLLGLAGVEDTDIIADYCISELYLTELYKELLASYLARWPEEKAGLDSPFFSTAPGNMKTLLNYLNETYGGVEGFVKNCGVSEQEIAALREKLIAI